MSTHRTVVTDEGYSTRVVVERVGNSIKLKRSDRGGTGKIFIPVDEVEDVAAVMRSLSEE